MSRSSGESEFRVLVSSLIKHCSRSFRGLDDDTYAAWLNAGHRNVHTEHRCLSVYLNRHSYHKIQSKRRWSTQK